jgi:diketogulonate reductase-like aldo/keto reductase
MPMVGFGTWQLEGDVGAQAVKSALEAGYRHIDTAQDYTNEADVGRGIVASTVPRADIFLVTKLSDLEDFKQGQVATRFEQQLRDLQTDYVDLYMLHNPADKELTLVAWRQLEDLHNQGKIRALGVSNFNESRLSHLLENAKVPPVYVQNKFSIYHHGSDDYESTKFLKYLNEKRIALVGYSLVNPFPYILPPLQDPHVLEIANALQKTPAQVLRRWSLQFGVGVLAKSEQQTHIAENADIFDFEISKEDMLELDRAHFAAKDEPSFLCRDTTERVKSLRTIV